MDTKSVEESEQQAARRIEATLDEDYGWKNTHISIAEDTEQPSYDGHGLRHVILKVQPPIGKMLVYEHYYDPDTQIVGEQSMLEVLDRGITESMNEALGL